MSYGWTGFSCRADSSFSPHRFGSFMGVAVAYPQKKYRLLESDIFTVAQHKPWPKAPNPPPKEPVSMPVRAALGVAKRMSSFVMMLPRGIHALFTAEQPPVKPPRTAADDWAQAKRRWNRLVSVKLQHTESGAPFAVSNYHMPCVYYAPRVMTIHSALAAQRAQQFASGLPLVLAGDWNLKPSSPEYGFLTTGHIEAEGPATPQYIQHDEWRITDGFEPLRSAYFEVNGKECVGLICVTSGSPLNIARPVSALRSVVPR